MLPTYNGEDDLRELLPVLAAQEPPAGAGDVPAAVEIVAIDSSSGDGTVAVLEEAGARVEVIPKSEFSHGRTRNRAARSARGEILVFLSQDTVPGDKGFLRELTSAFDDPQVAGAYARVLPHPDDDPLASRTVLDLPEASDEDVERDLGGALGLWELEPKERVEYLRFNNVASAIRADVFADFPFPDTAFAEDFAWASRVLSRGWKIAYRPSAFVYHAHSYSMRAAYERYRVDADFHRQAHGWLVRPSVTSVVRGIAYEVGRDLAYIPQCQHGRLRALLRSPALRTAQVLGQYAGSHGWGSTPLLRDELFDAIAPTEAARS